MYTNEKLRLHGEKKYIDENVFGNPRELYQPLTVSKRFQIDQLGSVIQSRKLSFFEIVFKLNLWPNLFVRSFLVLYFF